MTEGIAAPPIPPYWAVIFTSKLASDEGYGEMAIAMAGLAARQPGYLGVESARGADGLGITVSYWRDEHALMSWKGVAAHLVAQKLGRERWYEHYEVRVAKVERHYSGPEASPGTD